MEYVWIAAVLWVASHLLISSSPLRGMLVRLIGEPAYLGVYSLVAAGALVNLIWVYGDAPRLEYLWLPNPDLYWVAKLTMPIAFILLLGGFLARNPTAVGMQIDDPENAAALATGVTRITRHPLQWAIVIWGLGHIVANGDLVSIIFFGAFVVLSSLGSYLMDRKKAASFEGAEGEGWQRYVAVTSNVPFAAIVTGRNRLVLKELWLPVLIGLVAYGLAYYFHEALSGSVIV